MVWPSLANHGASFMEQSRGLLFGVLAVVASVLSAAPAVTRAAPAGAGGLTPHRVLYRVSLASAAAASGMTGVDGAMVYRFADGCDGWTVEKQTYLRLRYERGAEVESTWTFVSWESKDGLRYRFRMRHVRGGETVEVLQGTAALDRPGGAGVARFLKPADTTIDLPAGTLFPIQHLRALIDAARGGENPFARIVFEGTSLEEPEEISAVTGELAARERKALADAAGLADVPAWRMRLAFFPLTSRAAVPATEIDIHYRADGIAGDMRQDFGDFVIDMTPGEIEILAPPEC